MKNNIQDISVWLIIAIITYSIFSVLAEYTNNGILFTGGYVHHSFYTLYKKK